MSVEQGVDFERMNAKEIKQSAETCGARYRICSAWDIKCGASEAVVDARKSPPFAHEGFQSFGDDADATAVDAQVRQDECDLRCDRFEVGGLIEYRVTRRDRYFAPVVILHEETGEMALEQALIPPAAGR